MAFTRSAMPAHPSLIASYCKKCQSFVAASPKRSILKSAEQAHTCNGGGGLKNKRIRKPTD